MKLSKRSSPPPLLDFERRRSEIHVIRDNYLFILIREKESLSSKVDDMTITAKSTLT
jgi:hypothetical protein